jgi:hypothetical protein
VFGTRACVTLCFWHRFIDAAEADRVRYSEQAVLERGLANPSMVIGDADEYKRMLREASGKFELLDQV